jgi:hypothetical protein
MTTQRRIQSLVERSMAVACGGCLVLRGNSRWANGGRRIVCEPIRIVASLILAHLSQAQKNQILNALAHVVLHAEQEALMVVVGGRAYFLTPLSLEIERGHAA